MKLLVLVVFGVLLVSVCSGAQDSFTGIIGDEHHLYISGVQISGNIVVECLGGRLMVNGNTWDFAQDVTEDSDLSALYKYYSDVPYVLSKERVMGIDSAIIECRTLQKAFVDTLYYFQEELDSGRIEEGECESLANDLIRKSPYVDIVHYVNLRDGIFTLQFFSRPMPTSLVGVAMHRAALANMGSLEDKSRRISSAVYSEIVRAVSMPKDVVWVLLVGSNGDIRFYGGNRGESARECIKQTLEEGRICECRVSQYFLREILEARN